MVDFLGHLKSAVIHVEAHEELVAVLLYKSSRKFDLEFVSAIIKWDSMRFLYFEPVYEGSVFIILARADLKEFVFLVKQNKADFLCHVLGDDVGTKIKARLSFHQTMKF